jgi:hypothetical protein
MAGEPAIKIVTALQKYADKKESEQTEQPRGRNSIGDQASRTVVPSRGS